jgi:hypothetical protein
LAGFSRYLRFDIVRRCAFAWDFLYGNVFEVCLILSNMNCCLSYACFFSVKYDSLDPHFFYANLLSQRGFTKS